MKEFNKQREVLLVTSSPFLQKGLCGKGATSEDSFPERLEEACWNGMLKEWSMGLIPGYNSSEKSFLQKVLVADRILCAHISERPDPVDAYSSIDPFIFLKARLTNKS